MVHQGTKWKIATFHATRNNALSLSLSLSLSVCVCCCCSCCCTSFRRQSELHYAVSDDCGWARLAIRRHMGIICIYLGEWNLSRCWYNQQITSITGSITQGLVDIVAPLVYYWIFVPTVVGRAIEHQAHTHAHTSRMLSIYTHTHTHTERGGGQWEAGTKQISPLPNWKLSIGWHYRDLEVYFCLESAMFHCLFMLEPPVRL